MFDESSSTMETIWSWLITLPSPSQWPPSPPSLPLAVSDDENKSILLTAERTAGSDSEALLTFSISLNGFQTITTPSRTLWFSNPISPSDLHFPFLLQLLEESSSSIKLNKNSISTAFDNSHDATAALPSFLSLALLLRLFWLCATDAPGEAGFLFFKALDEPIQQALQDCKPAMKTFCLSVGPDVEKLFMQSLGYMLSKWCLLRELAAGIPRLRPAIPVGSCPSYSANQFGLFILKGFAPVQAMNRSRPESAPKDAVLRYALAHQQLQLVVQLEYAICTKDQRFIRVSVHMDNIRAHVARLRCNSNNNNVGCADTNTDDDNGADTERHFPSRIRVWVGPEFGSGYAVGPSLGRSTGNPDRELKMSKTIQGRVNGEKACAMKTATRTKSKSWKWEQGAEGGAGVFEGMCEGAIGNEVYEGTKRRVRGFDKYGGVVVARDEVGESVEWRVGKEMEGRKLKWRIGGKVWLSYYGSEGKSEYCDTRWVEWKEELEFDLVGAKF